METKALLRVEINSYIYSSFDFTLGGVCFSRFREHEYAYALSFVYIHNYWFSSTCHGSQAIESP